MDEPGSICHNFVSVYDFMPSWLEVAKVEYPMSFEGRKIEPLAGESFLPLLNGGVAEDKERTALFWYKSKSTVCFIKGKWKTGEQEAIKRFPEIEHIVSGEGFTWNSQDHEKDIAAARRGWDEALRIIAASRGDTPAYDVLVLDELNIALRYGHLPVAEVVGVLADLPTELSVVVTGRDAPAALIEVAHTVTEMVPVKHAFKAGIKARKGVDF